MFHTSYLPSTKCPPFPASPPIPYLFALSSLSSTFCSLSFLPIFFIFKDLIFIVAISGVFPTLPGSLRTTSPSWPGGTPLSGGSASAPLMGRGSPLEM